jgi:chaperonin GroES
MIEKHKIRAGMLLVRPSEAKEEKTKSGLIIPVTAATEPNNGKVVLVGRPLPTDPHDIHIGDVVYYGERSGQEITLYDQKYRLLMVRETLSWIPKDELDKLLN